MKPKILIIAIIILLSLFAWYKNEACAAEVQIVSSASEETISKLKGFFNKNSFPDSAYVVEIKKSTIEGNTLKVMFKLNPKQEFFESLKSIFNDELKNRLKIEAVEESKKRGDSVPEEDRGTKFKLLNEIYTVPSSVALYFENTMHEFHSDIRFVLKDNVGNTLQKNDLKIHLIPYFDTIIKNYRVKVNFDRAPHIDSEDSGDRYDKFTGLLTP